MPVVGGAHYILEGRDNYTYTTLNIKIILYCRANSKTSLILLLVLGESALDNLYLLDSCKIYGDDRGHTVGCCIYT
jgi:hypothetical protein